MALSKIKYGNSGKIALTINNLTSVGKTLGDITNVLFMFKDTADQKDDDAPLRKELRQGEISIIGDKLVVTIEKEDFGDSAARVQSGVTYLIAIGVEFNNSGEYFEDQDDNLSRKIKVVADKVGK